MKKQMMLAALLCCATLAHAAKVGDPAPKFALMNTRNQRRLLADFKGKAVLVNFWASWCGPCQVELPELNRLAAEYKGKKVQVLAINVDENRSEAAAALERLGLSASTMMILLDPQSKAVSAYNIETMPSSFLLDDKGIIRFAHKGYRGSDPRLWRLEIDSLLPNK